MLTVTSEDICCSIPNVEFDIIKVMQLYNAFVVSDVCNPSLCVIPFRTEIACVAGVERGRG